MWHFSRFSIFIKYIIVREYGHVKSKLCQFRFQLVFELSEQKVLSFLAEIMDLCIASAVCTGKFFNVQKIVPTQNQINILTKAVDDVPSFTEARPPFEQQIF